jgi:hypothetical protein
VRAKIGSERADHAAAGLGNRLRALEFDDALVDD